MRTKNTGQKEKRNEPGFTLIELMVSISIIGLLASVILAALQQARTKAEFTANREYIHGIKLALDSYNIDNNDYPTVSYSGTGIDGIANIGFLQNTLVPRYASSIDAPNFPNIYPSVQ